MKYETPIIDVMIIEQEVFMALSNGGTGDGDSIGWGDFFV